MGLIKKVAAAGAIAAVGALAVNRKAVTKAVKGLLGKAEKLEAKVLPEAKDMAASVEKKVKRIAKTAGEKKPRAARRKARHAAAHA